MIWFAIYMVGVVLAVLWCVLAITVFTILRYAWRFLKALFGQ
jgi:hypothetical protein